MITILLAFLILPIVFVFWCMLKISSVSDREEELIISILNENKK